jgi:hypothetical protein
MAQIPEPNKIPQHSIGIVGGRGSGKTVYLATLYHYLSTQRENVGFSLNAPPHQAKMLVAMFAELAGHRWLRATRYQEISEWPFSLWASGNNNRAWEACSFVYYDYAGGLVDQANPDTIKETIELAEKIKNCHAIVALLDGEKISQFILGNNQALKSAFIFNDLPNIINTIQPAVRSGGVRSLQFVITKWDHVERAGATLKQIKDFLLSLEQLNQFLSTIHTRRQEIIVDAENRTCSESVTMPLIRLIPISSVGFEFIKRYDPEDGMIINENAHPTPWNVHYPLACIFIDVLRAEIEALQRKQDKTKEQKFSSLQSNLETMLIHGGKVLLKHIPRKYLGNVRFIGLLHDILEEKMFSLEERENERYQKFLRIKEDSLLRLEDNVTAFNHAAQMCSLMQQELDITFPDNTIK